jgi:hypothetical protein
MKVKGIYGFISQCNLAHSIKVQINKCLRKQYGSTPPSYLFRFRNKLNYFFGNLEKNLNYIFEMLKFKEITREGKMQKNGGKLGVSSSRLEDHCKVGIQ